MALTSWTDFVAAHPDKALQLCPAYLCAKGTGATSLYLLQCNSASGNLITTGEAGATPTEFGDFVTNNNAESRQLPPILLLAKGNADNNFYLLEVDSVTGALATS